MTLEQAMRKVQNKYGRINGKNTDPFDSNYEGLAHVDECMDDLKHEVRNGNRSEMRKAAEELAAMTVTFLTDCC